MLRQEQGTVPAVPTGPHLGVSILARPGGKRALPPVGAYLRRPSRPMTDR
jgi:hypothetical protein